MKTFLFSIITLIGAGISTCTPELTNRWLTAEEFNQAIEDKKDNTRPITPQCCRESLSYAPDTMYLDHFTKRIVRVNFHYMYDGQGQSNISQDKAVKKAKDVLLYCNSLWRRNQKMNLPIGNDTPVLPISIQFQLTPRPGVPGDTGVYFHEDDELFAFVKRGRNENRGSRKVIDKYGVQLDTVLNIFVMPHHPDSLSSEKYRSDITGIALRNATKVAGWAANPKTKDWDLAKNLNHEIGHLLGLGHTWSGSDGCDDTPNHPNCWNRTNNGSACDSLVSNNLMDTNANKSCLTPCQIGRMHKNLSKERKTCRNFLLEDWCTMTPSKSITIRDSIHWQGSKDIRGNITIIDGATLKISCRTSMPQFSKIAVMPGGKLILDNCKLHNSCGYEWEGIKIFEQNKKVGEVEIIGKPQIENASNLVVR